MFKRVFFYLLHPVSILLTSIKFCIFIRGSGKSNSLFHAESDTFELLFLHVFSVFSMSSIY